MLRKSTDLKGGFSKDYPNTQREVRRASTIKSKFRSLTPIIEERNNDTFGYKSRGKSNT